MATVFVGNLSADVTDEDIRKLFAEYGHVLSVRLLARRRTAFVELDADAAAAAVDALRGKQLKDRTMDVALEGPRSGRGGGGGGRRGGRRH